MHEHEEVSTTHHSQPVNLTRVNSRSRADILEGRVIDGLAEDGVGQLVRAGEADTSRVGASATGDLDLEARHVGLGVSGAGVQGQDLGADEVVARGDVLGDREGALAAVGVEDLRAPGGRAALVAVLGDLEEGAGGGGGGVGHLRHVDEDGAVVGAADGGVGARAVAGLGVHLDGEGGAGWGLLVHCLYIHLSDGCDIPATSQTPLLLAGPRPQNMSAEDRLSMGLLSLTVRTHLPAWSVDPTHSCCHVE